jgi:hypothetical protein
LIRGIRINKIDIYLPPVAAGTNTFSLTWASQLGCPRTMNLSTMGTASIGYLNSRPPVDSLAAFWSITGSNESELLFNCDTPAAAVFDIHVTYMLQNFVTATVAPVITSSTVALTTGVVYVAAADGTTTNALVPDGWLQF